MQGYAPQVAIEFGRKVLYSTDRPSFTELESHVKARSDVGTSAAAPEPPPMAASAHAVERRAHGDA